MARSVRRRNQLTAAVLETLEPRTFFAVHNDSFDVTGLTSLRSTLPAITGAGIGIAVLDTGVDAANPDLSSKVEAFYNAVENPVPTTVSSNSVSAAVDNDGHGTHVSGIAASADPNIGVAYGADLVDVKVIADNNETQLAGDPLLRGLEFVQDYASKYNIKVVNMSLGESTQSGGINDNTVPASDDLSAEIKTLESMGITVVAAAGNSYANDPVPGESYPAVVSTIGVANVYADTGTSSNFGTYSYGTSYDSWAAEESSAQADQLAATSQRSTLNNQVVAPGMNIVSDWNGTSSENSGSDLLLNTLSGTSMASPFVSGLVALMQQTAYTYGGRYITDPQQVLSIIKETSDVIQDPASNHGDTRVPIDNGSLTGGAAESLTGTGDTYDRVNVLNAIKAVIGLFTGTISNAPTNNTIATSTVVPTLNGTADVTETNNIGTDGLAQVGDEDVKVYKVVLDETGALTAALSQTTGGTGFTATLRLFNSSGGQIAIDVGTSAVGYPTLTTSGSPLVAGTYFVGVSSAGNNAYSIVDGTGATGGSTTGDYTLVFTLGNPDPNGVPAGAQQVQLTDPNYEATGGTVSNQFNGILGSDPPATGSTTRVSVPNGDVDMFEMVAPDTGTITASADVSAYGIDGADTYLEVFDSNLNLVAQNGQNTGSPSASQISFNATVGGTYYVAVTVAANAGFTPTNPYTRVVGTTSTPGDYDLYLTFNNGNTDGTALLANTETIGQTADGKIASTDNSLGSAGGSKYVDWYDYRSTSAGLLDVTATASTSGFAPNIEFWTLYTNTSGATVISEVGGITGSGKSLIYNVTADETIYVSVTGAGNSNFNWYSLGSGSGGETGTYTLTSTLKTGTTLNTLNDGSVDNGTPQSITAGQTVTGDIGNYDGYVIGATDVDLYKFVPTTTGLYDISTDTSQEGSVDTYLRLFDSSGDQLTANDNAGNSTTASNIRASLTAGQTYYIGVSGSGNEAYDPISGTGATASSTTGTYTLAVAAATRPAVTINNPAAVSPASTGAAVVFTVSLDFAATTPVTVNYATADVSAVAGVDYTATSGTLTIPTGATSATVSVPVLVDAAATASSTFDLNLSDPSANAVVDGGQGVGTIANLLTTSSVLSSRQRVMYVDGNGRKVIVSLTGPGSGVVTVVGSTATGGPASSVSITLNDTTARSTLSVTTTRGQTTALDGLQINGDLGIFNGAQVDLAGNLTVTGTIGDLILDGTTGAHTLSVDGSGRAGSLNLGNVLDLIVTSAEPLNSVAVKDWINTAGTDLLNAPSIRTLSSKSNFAASLTVAGAVNAVRVAKVISAGAWSVGSIGSLQAQSTDAAWTVAVAGSIGSVLVTTNASGNVSAGEIGTFAVRGNWSSGSVTVAEAATGKAPAVYTFAVGGTITDSVLRSAGTIDMVRAGAIFGSSILAGVSPAVAPLSLLTAGSQVAGGATIENFAVTGVRGETTLFGDSVVDAAFLGHVAVSKVATDNGGTAFGFAADSVGSFIDAQPGAKIFRWNDKLPVAGLTADGDFLVRVL